jgi:hypothetical protein
VAAILAQWSPGLLARAFRVRSRWQASGL